MLEASELARWTRFAAKGGIGQCTALQDCVAQGAEDLMFLKDDSITVLMQIPEQEDVFLGYCEGVVGRFQGPHVHFHSKLKKPIMTKRSSIAASKSSSSKDSSPTPFVNSPTADFENEASPRPPGSPSPAASRRGASMPASRSQSSEPPLEIDIPSLSSASQLSSEVSAGSTTSLAPPASAQATANSLPLGGVDISSTRFSSSRPHIQVDHEAHLPSTMSYSSTSSVSESFPNTPSSALGPVQSLNHLTGNEQHDQPKPATSYRKTVQPLNFRRKGDGGIESPLATPLGTPASAAKSDEESFRARTSLASSDGEVGIGLSLLQDLANGTDMDDWSSTKSGRSSRSDTHIPDHEQHPNRIITDSPDLIVDPDRDDSIGVKMASSSTSTSASRKPSQSTQASRTSSTPASTHRTQSSVGDDWEGASDIYDDYRYSRFSVASRISRFSQSSGPAASSSSVGAVPPPMPKDPRRPSVDRAHSHSSDNADRPNGAATGPVLPNALVLDMSAARSWERPTSLHDSQSPLLHTSFDSPEASPSMSASSGFLGNLSTTSPSLDLVSRRLTDHNRTSSQMQVGSEDDGSSRPGGGAPPADDADPRDSELRAQSGTGSRQSQSPSSSADSLSNCHDADSLSSLSAFPTPPGLVSINYPVNSQPVATTPESTSPAAPTFGDSYVSQPDFRRRSIFLPHPNAPKPPASSAGPLYARNITAQPPTQDPQAPYNHTSVNVLRQAVAARVAPDGSIRATTLYGQCEVDLSQAVGPVPIRFGLEPPASVPAIMMQSGPAVASVPPRPSTASPSLTASRSFDRGSTSGPSASPPIGVMLADSRNNLPSTGNALPRANFFPKVQTPRPRSRSFSGFDSHITGISHSSERSLEEGSKPLVATSAGVSSSDLALSSNILSKNSPAAKLAAARAAHAPSPLSLPQNNSAVVGQPSSLMPHIRSPQLSSPPSPLSPSPSPLSSGFRSSPQKLRHVSSSTAMHTEKQPLHPTAALPPLARRSSSEATSPVPSSPLAPSPRSPGVRDSRSAISASTASSREAAPQSPVIPSHRGSEDVGSGSGEVRADVIRNRSLRKMSLPSLRTKSGTSRPDEASPVQGDHSNGDLETVQVKDTDFELVRPVVSRYSSSRNSEDSAFSPRDNPSSFDYGLLRVDSPNLSLHSAAHSGQRSPSSVSEFSFSQSKSGRSPDPDVSSIEAHRQRELKWMSLMSAVPPSQARKNKKIKKLLFEGVPSSVRYLVWAHLTDSKSKCIQGLYSHLGSRGRVAASGDIQSDVAKCFQDQPQLHGPHGPVVSLLQAYLAMVPDIRYHIGLTCIAGHLLLMSPEEDAFWIFVSLMDTHLRSYFFVNAVQMDIDAALFSKALEVNDPRMARKVYVDMGMSPVAICRPWFASLFTGALPVKHLHRVWDIFLYEGIAFLFRVGLAVFNCSRRPIMDAIREEVIFQHLRHPSLPSSVDAFISLVYSMKLKDDDVRKQRVKMEAQLKRHTQSRAVSMGPSGARPVTSISLPRG